MLIDAFEGGGFAALFRLARHRIRVNLAKLPGPGVTRIGRDGCHQQLVRTLVPEDQLLFAVAQEIAKRLVVMLRAHRVLDGVP